MDMHWSGRWVLGFVVPMEGDIYTYASIAFQLVIEFMSCGLVTWNLRPRSGVYIIQDGNPND